MLMGSADLMPRNLDSRVELVTPVEDPDLRTEMLDVLERCFADNANAWELGADGAWTRLAASRGGSGAASRRSCASATPQRAAEQLAAAAG